MDGVRCSRLEQCRLVLICIRLARWVRERNRHEAWPSIAMVEPERRVRSADVHADQATDKRGNETRCLLAQLLSRRLLPDADYHDDEQEDDEDGHGQNEKNEDREHQFSALSAMTRSREMGGAMF
jgi:hypothetical protein